MAGNCIVDDEVCRAASRMEILRRYYTAKTELVQGQGGGGDCPQAGAGDAAGRRDAGDLPRRGSGAGQGGSHRRSRRRHGAAGWRIITGKTSGTLGAAAALLLNALKALGNIDDQFELISKQVLEPVCHLKTTYLDHRNPPTPHRRGTADPGDLRPDQPAGGPCQAAAARSPGQ